MDEFIESFNKFKEWLFDSYRTAQPEDKTLLKSVVDRFKELDLDKDF